MSNTPIYRSQHRNGRSSSRRQQLLVAGGVAGVVVAGAVLGNVPRFAGKVQAGLADPSIAANGARMGAVAAVREFPALGPAIVRNSSPSPPAQSPDTAAAAPAQPPSSRALPQSLPLAPLVSAVLATRQPPAADSRRPPAEDDAPIQAEMVQPSQPADAQPSQPADTRPSPSPSTVAASGSDADAPAAPPATPHLAQAPRPLIPPAITSAPQVLDAVNPSATGMGAPAIIEASDPGRQQQTVNTTPVFVSIPSPASGNGQPSNGGSDGNSIAHISVAPAQPPPSPVAGNPVGVPTISPVNTPAPPAPPQGNGGDPAIGVPHISIPGTGNAGGQPVHVGGGDTGGNQGSGRGH